ncbi:MAG: arsenic resistance protein [Pseudomonadota bacterium]
MLTKSLSRAASFVSGQGTAIFLIAAIVFGAAFGTIAPDSEKLSSEQIDITILALVFFLLFEIRLQSILSSIKRVPLIAVALLANFVIIPVLGYAIASVFLSAHPLFFIGLVIYFMAPCTDWFLAFTRLARGNTALGAALIPINMIFQLLLYPVYLHLFDIGTVGIDSIGNFQTLWHWFLVPLLLAISIRILAERLLNQAQFDVAQALISLLFPVLLAVLVWQLTASNIGTLTANITVFPLIFCAILTFFLATYLLSEAVAKWMGLAYEDRVLITMTTAARNAPLMLAITIVVLPNQPLIYAAIIIGMLVELPHLVALKSILLRQRNSRRGKNLELDNKLAS